MNRRHLLLCAVLLTCQSVATAADDVIAIVHRDNPHPIDKAYVVGIYTGRLKGWPDGSPVFPLDQDLGGEVRDAFCQEWLGRSPAAVNAIWAQNIFTGKALPPKIVAADERMKRIVATNRNAIGYIRRSALDDTVRALAR